MRWRQINQKRSFYLDFIFSQEIIYTAYSEGFINWNVYQKAMEKINSNINSMENNGWMFEKGSERIDFLKEYGDEEDMDWIVYQKEIDEINSKLNEGGLIEKGDRN